MTIKLFKRLLTRFYLKTKGEEMAILDREKFMERIKAMVGEDTSDEAMSFIEDMTDTYNDVTKAKEDTTDWKQKYEENDKAWRTKYKERFFNGSSTEDKDILEPPKDEPKPEENITFDDLFTEKE